jgi:hypothetical protein
MSCVAAGPPVIERKGAMNRRFAWAVSAALLLSVSVGCNASFWPSAAAKKPVDPYSAVATGMTERDVVKLMGEPSSRRGIRLEGRGAQATSLTWVGHNRLMTVTLVKNQVIAKQRS